jgi:hypothetical protein
MERDLIQPILQSQKRRLKITDPRTVADVVAELTLSHASTVLPPPHLPENQVSSTLPPSIPDNTRDFLLPLSGTRRDISTATPIRERVWTDTVRHLATQAGLGVPAEQLAHMRREIARQMNQYPRATWWIDHEAQLE